MADTTNSNSGAEQESINPIYQFFAINVECQQESDLRFEYGGQNFQSQYEAVKGALDSEPGYPFPSSVALGTFAASNKTMISDEFGRPAVIGQTNSPDAVSQFRTSIQASSSLSSQGSSSSESDELDALQKAAQTAADKYLQEVMEKDPDLKGQSSSSESSGSQLLGDDWYFRYKYGIGIYTLKEALIAAQEL